MATFASIITIGDELLIGQTIDTNSAWIGQRLNELGLDLVRRVAVGDDRDAIRNALDEELSKAQIVIVTGGLGPTADDITKPLLADYFHCGMHTDETVLAHVKGIFEGLGRPMLERNMKQAEVPDACTVLFNTRGTAPGMWFEKDGRVIVSLPGVPHEMAGIMTDEVLPRLQERFTGSAIVHASLITAGEGESFLAEKIKDIEEALPPHIKLAYLPGARMVKLRLTGRGSDKTMLTEEVAHHQRLLIERLGKIVVATEDIPLEAMLLKWFTTNNKTLALAESCTGGSIADHITNVPGASGYFKGSVVCYDQSVKERLGVHRETIDTYGIVSEETATEMAVGTRLKLRADVGLGITGFLGPSAEGNVPVGTICIAISDENATIARTFHFRYDRRRNKEVAVSVAMQQLLRFVTNTQS
jgi:nicotinamide-nucleotide amidase